MASLCIWVNRLLPAILVTVLTACSPNQSQLPQTHKAPHQQVLRTHLAKEPTSFDPRISSDVSSASLLDMMWAGVVQSGRDGQPYLELADSLEISDDQLSYRFHLRKNFWSDGTPITAPQIVASWQSCLNPDFPCKQAPLFYCLRGARAARAGTLPLNEVGVHAEDDQTLVLELERPTPHLLHILTSPAFSPVHPQFVNQPIEECNINATDYICSGPFRPKLFHIQRNLILEKNPYYWNADHVQLQEVHFSMVSDPHAALLMFERGELDWLGAPLSEIPPDAVPFLKQSKQLTNHPTAGTRWLEFNTQRFPFHNRHIRKAFALAINRAALIEHIIQFDDRPSLGLVPPFQKILPYQPFFRDNDIELARTHFALGLEELNLSPKEFPVVTLQYNTSETWDRIAKWCRAQWESTLGVRIRLEHYDWKVHLAKLEAKNFSIGRFGWGPQFNDPINILEIFQSASGPNNHTGWEHPEYAHYLELANQTADPIERAHYLERAEAILMDEAPLAPIYHYSNPAIQHPYVQGVHMGLLDTVDFRWTHIDPNPS